MWISSYCIAFIYQQNTKVKQLFSPLTYEDSHSPAMKQTIHICSVDNLVEEINNIIQNKQECQTMEYDIQFICCSCKITEIERKPILRKLRKKTCMTAWNQLPIGVFSIVFCIASYSICFSSVAWQSSGRNNEYPMNKIKEKHVSYICTRPYRLMSGITSWLLIIEKNKQVSGWNKFWQLH